MTDVPDKKELSPADDAERQYFADQLHSDISVDFNSDDRDEIVTLMQRIHAEGYEQGYQDGLEAPPPEPSHQYE